MSLLKNSLKTLVLAGSMLFASGDLKAQQKVQQHKDSLTHVLEAQKRQATILQSLRAKSVFDKKSEVSYVFDKVPTDLETIGVASRNNIFYAEPGKLLIGGDAMIINKLKALGYTPTRVAHNLYEINVSGDIVNTKQHLHTILKTDQIIFKYSAYTSACPTFNDPQAYPQSGNQYHLFDKIWTDFGIFDAPTHSRDSIESKKPLHVQSTMAIPNVVINIFDGGFDINNQEFAGRVLWRWNHTTDNVNTTSTNHGTSVAYIAAATANNNYGGVGMYDGPIRLYQISSDGITINVVNLHKAIDSLTQHCLQFPNQRQINNFSFGSGNDATLLSKLTTLYNMNGGKQNFFQAGTGNSGATTVSWPALWDVTTARGATNAISNLKPIWASSNTGPSMVVNGYVNDGQNVKAMQADGSIATVNGTSFSTPMGTGTVAWLVSQDTSRNHADVNALLDEGAKDLGAAGPDNIYGKGWARTNVSLMKAVVRHVPNSFDAATTPTYNFVPKYYNKHNITTGTRNEKIYINGSTTAINPTTYNGQNQAEFLLSFVTTNGFVNGSNTIKYEFTTPDGCTSWAYKTITLSNVATPTPPPIPDIRNVDPTECQSNPAQTGKLMNPPVSPATIQIVQDGATTLPFNWSDSTFSYNVGGAGAHNIRVTYQNAAGSNLKDTAYNVTAAITPAATAPSASANTICSGQNSTLTANYSNMGANPTFQWYRNGSIIPGATSATYNYTNAVAGTQAFHVIVTPTAGGCYTNSSPVTSPITNVTVQALPNATNQTLTQPTCVIPSGTATINNLGSGNTWKVDNGPWVSTPSIAGLAPGAHNAYQQTSIGCASPASPFTINTVTGCTPVITQSVNTMSTPTVSGATYQWYLNGNPIAGATSNTFTSMFAGTFTVVVTQGTTPYTSAPYNFTPTIAVAPNNYRVQETDVVCRGDNNGKIIVATQQNLSYVMTTTGPNGYNNTTNFVGTSAQLTNLPAGTYQVCFNIVGIPAASYTQCFNTVVNEPRDLAVLNRIVPGGQGTAIELQLSGGTNYYINLNGVDYSTRDSVITLMLQQGQNTIKITTDQACQGTFEKTIYVGDQSKLNVFPNPVQNNATVHIPGIDQKVVVQVFGGSGAALYRKDVLLGQDRLAQIPTGALPSGVYYLHVRSASYTGTVKFIKQ